MTVQLIATATRPSTDIPWHNYSNDKGFYMNDPYYLLNWHGSSKLISMTSSISEDGLSGTIIREFSDWQALDDYVADANLLPARILMTTYHKSVGIETINLETKEI